jgi:hypothetical protein
MRHVRLGLILAGIGALGLGVWTEGCLFAPDNCADLLRCAGTGATGAGGDGSTAVTSGNGGSTSGNGGFDGSTTSSGDVGSSTSSGGPVACTTAADCAGNSTLCSEVACMGGVCGIHQLQGDGPSVSQVYGDCRKAICAQGKLVLTVTDQDIYDDGNPCTKDACTNGTPTNTILTGSSCGVSGVCSAKGACVECLGNGNCTDPTPTCVNSYCSAGTCQNQMPDGTETDVDCGGPTCGPCAAGQVCKVASDCTTKVCEDAFAGALFKNCQLPTCADGVQNGAETDVDCGGPICPAASKCLESKQCTLAGDCASGVCQAGACKKATCNDGVKNGLETGVDCGAPGCLVPECPGA